jgi:hypothetical protein
MGTALSDNTISGFDYDDLFASLFRVQSIAALDEFLGHQADRPHFWMFNAFGLVSRALDAVPEATLLSWAQADSQIRFPQLAAAVSLFEDEEGEASKLVWSSKALAVLHQAPEPAAVLAKFSSRLMPRSWSGSLADAIEKRSAALSELSSHENPIVRDWASDQNTYLAQVALEERQRDRRTDESFE